MTRFDILNWLQETNPHTLDTLYSQADAIRKRSVGDPVYLGGLIEISNHCERRCAYCGINQSRCSMPRYRMTAEEILAAAAQAKAFGYGWVILQSGEDDGLKADVICKVIQGIQQDVGLPVTLSLGERPLHDLEAFRKAGTERYLLRFETSDPELYERIHPPRENHPSDRLTHLESLRRLGYDIGTGIMVGIPGQTFDILAQDIERFRDLDLDTIAVSPYVPHPNTPLGRGELPMAPHGEQVPAGLEMTCKTLALTRLLCPDANLPTAPAITTADANCGRKLGLQRGANVLTPNLTPLKYRALYDLYPSKAGILERPRESDRIAKELLRELARPIAAGTGARRGNKGDNDSSRAA